MPPYQRCQSISVYTERGKDVISSKRVLFVLAVLITCGLGTMSANSIPLGQVTLPFTAADACINNSGTCTPGTATGYFDYNPTNNTITSWDFQVTGSSDGAFGGLGSSNGTAGAPRTYSSSDIGIGATATITSSNFFTAGNGKNLEFVFQEANTNTNNQFQIVIQCAVTTLNASANCLDSGALLASYTLLTQPPTNGTVSGSGEIMDVPSDTASRALSDGFLTVTDPNGIFAFNLSPTATPPCTTNCGTSVPEPGTMPLLAAGLGALVAFTMWKRGSLASLA
jgi:hypothetical protein